MENELGKMGNIIICGAKTRAGTPCTSKAEEGKRRCRIHGGAKGSGGQLGNKNALKHGYYCRENIAQRSQIHKLIQDYRKLCKDMNL